MEPVVVTAADHLSQGLFLTLFLLLGLSWSLNLAWVLTRKPRYSDWARKVLWFSLAFNALALVHRWVSAGHAPWANQYESATMVAFGVVLLFA
ncbi:MAG TPA: hypothetical protein VK842_01895, partial [bacterium]|nr:hypothetical protein [bacterium]